MYLFPWNTPSLRWYLFSYSGVCQASRVPGHGDFAQWLQWGEQAVEIRNEYGFKQIGTRGWSIVWTYFKCSPQEVTVEVHGVQQGEDEIEETRVSPLLLCYCGCLIYILHALPMFQYWYWGVGESLVVVLPWLLIYLSSCFLCWLTLKRCKPLFSGVSQSNASKWKTQASESESASEGKLDSKNNVNMELSMLRH